MAGARNRRRIQKALSKGALENIPFRPSELDTEYPIVTTKNNGIAVKLLTVKINRAILKSN